MEFEVSYSLDDEQQFWDGLLISTTFPGRALETAVLVNTTC